MKILIVEDEALIALNIRDVLEDYGHQVVEIADDEPSALLAATHYRPDLALVDMRLAGGDSGMEVARKISAMGVAVIFATGNCPGKLVDEVAIGCLHKPLSDAQIVAGVAIAEAVVSEASPPPPPPGMHMFQ